MADTGPFFSIIIPTFSEGSYLRETLESIKRQKFQDYEIIVSDFNSVDGTIQIAKEYGATVLNSTKAGASYARNFGALGSKGKFLVFLDADTTMWPDCLSVFKRETEIGTIAGFPLIEWATKNKFYEMFRAYIINPIYYLGAMLNSGLSYPCCCFYEKEAFLNTNGFDERTPIFSNFDLNKEVLKSGKLKLLTNAKCYTSDRRVQNFGLFSYCMTATYAFTLKVLKNKVLPLDFYEPVR